MFHTSAFYCGFCWDWGNSMVKFYFFVFAIITSGCVEIPPLLNCQRGRNNRSFYREALVARAVLKGSMLYEGRCSYICFDSVNRSRLHISTVNVLKDSAHREACVQKLSLRTSQTHNKAVWNGPSPAHLDPTSDLYCFIALTVFLQSAGFFFIGSFRVLLTCCSWSSRVKMSNYAVLTLFPKTMKMYLFVASHTLYNIGNEGHRRPSKLCKPLITDCKYLYNEFRSVCAVDKI